MADTKISAAATTMPVRTDVLPLVRVNDATARKAAVSDVLNGPVLLVAASDASAAALRHADYICDGTADDVQIQAALDAAAAAGSGKVLLSAGNFFLAAALRLGDYTAFSGMGRNTVLKLATGANGDVVTNADWANGNTGLLIENLYLDGNRLNQSHVVGDGPGQSCVTLVNCTKNTIRNVWGTSPRLHGIDLAPRNVSGNPDGDPGCSDIVIHGCGFEDFGDDAFTFHYSQRISLSQCAAWNAAASYSGSSNGVECDDGSHDITISDILINDCASGVVCQAHDGRPPAYNVTISGVIVQDCTQGLHYSAMDAIDPGGVNAERIVALGCLIRGCTTGVRVEGYRNVHFIGCVILDCTNTVNSTSTDSARTCNIFFDNCEIRSTTTNLNLANVGPLTFHQCAWSASDGGQAVNVAMADVTLDGCLVTGATGVGVILNATGTRTKIINCTIRDNTNVGVRVIGAVTDFRIENNEIRNNGTSTGQLWFDDGGCSGLVLGNTIVEGVAAIYLEGDAPGVLIANNYLEGSSYTIRYFTATGYQVRQNIGFISEAGGTATVPNGATTVAVTHGLGRAPTLQEIQVAATNNLGNAAKFWISAPTATQFALNVDTDPGVATAAFVWQAALR